MHNPALRQESRYEPAAVLPIQNELSLIDWLKATNRLIPRENNELENTPELDEELAEFIEGDDKEFDDFDTEGGFGDDDL
jgi:Protein of unknown function (DUF3134)